MSFELCVCVCVPPYRGISSSKVTVLGYGLLTTDARPLVDALSRQRFAVVVVDESHYLKSRNAARTKILAPLIQGAKRAILLTGTPALGRPEEVKQSDKREFGELPIMGVSFHFFFLLAFSKVLILNPD